ncbi:MAG: hypothetical protein GX369_06105 [Euryarchaeota archaeon]|nr:hypothetical protein [Euryarchaeota archaeon]
MSNMEWSGSFELDRLDISNLPDEAEGVYRISRFKSLSESPIIIYIDQGKLKDRLMHHISEDEENVCIRHVLSKRKCWFDYCIISTESEREQVKKDEINILDPSCNRSRRR